MSQWISGHLAERAKRTGSASMVSRPQRIVKVKAGSSSGVKPKALTVTVDIKSDPVEAGRAIGGAGKVTMFKLNHSPAAAQLEDVLAQSALQTDIPTARSVNVHVG
ncbi:MAG TPA: hypothetical protein VMP13_06275 [Acidimicrobiia bacterium]|nr:hypothetical protein [Acidimicrobiia bacterium]